MKRSILLAVSVAATATMVVPALAAPKTMGETYTATAGTPDPTPITGATGGNCHPTLKQAQHEKVIKLPAAGTWTIDLNGFQGDWALAILDKKGATLADSDNDITTAANFPPEHIKYKIKKPGDYTIRACNFLGGPTATVKWSFTYGK